MWRSDLALNMRCRQSFLPGSHKRNTITSRFVRMPTGGTGFVPWGSQEEKDTAWSAEPGWTEATCKAGSLVLIHGARDVGLRIIGDSGRR